jgi:predicted Zn-dependent peptidase
MESIRSITIGFWFRQGRVHEAGTELGASHLLEHMVFKGTARRSSRELAWAVERLGGTLDAYTTHEATAYHARIPAEGLNIALDVLTDLTFYPLLRESDLRLEREVVLEEIAATEDVPVEVAFEKHACFLYDGHPYGEPIIGTRDSVTALSAESLSGVHRHAYQPGNLVVAAAGNIEHLALVDSLRTLLPEGEPPVTEESAEVPVGAIGVRRVEQGGGRQIHIVTGGLSTSYKDPLRYALLVTSTTLGEGMSSRLFQRVREELGLSYTVYSFHGFFSKIGHVGAYVATRPESAPAARDALFSELASIAAAGITIKELENTTAQLKGQILISLESPVARMNRLAGVALYGHPYRTLDEMASRIDTVSLDQCEEAARFFDPTRLATLELAPKH